MRTLPDLLKPRIDELDGDLPAYLEMCLARVDLDRVRLAIEAGNQTAAVILARAAAKRFQFTKE